MTNISGWVSTSLWPSYSELSTNPKNDLKVSGWAVVRLDNYLEMATRHNNRIIRLKNLKALISTYKCRHVSSSITLSRTLRQRVFDPDQIQDTLQEYSSPPMDQRVQVNITNSAPRLISVRSHFPSCYTIFSRSSSLPCLKSWTNIAATSSGQTSKWSFVILHLVRY